MSLLSGIRFVSETEIKKRAQAAANAKLHHDNQQRAAMARGADRGRGGRTRSKKSTEDATVHQNWVNPALERRLRQHKPAAKLASETAKKKKKKKKKKKSKKQHKKKQHKKKSKKNRSKASSTSSSSDSSDSDEQATNAPTAVATAATAAADRARMGWMMSEPSRQKSPDQLAAEKEQKRIEEENAKVDAYEAAEIAAGRMDPKTKVVYGLWRPKKDKRPQRRSAAAGSGAEGSGSSDPFAKFGTILSSRHRTGEHHRAGKGSLYSDKDVISRHSRKLGAAIATVAAASGSGGGDGGGGGSGSGGSGSSGVRGSSRQSSSDRGVERRHRHRDSGDTGGRGEGDRGHRDQGRDRRHRDEYVRTSWVHRPFISLVWRHRVRCKCVCARAHLPVCLIRQ